MNAPVANESLRAESVRAAPKESALMRLTGMVGTYPHTQALKAAGLVTPGLELDFADVASAPAAFRRVLAGEFDLAELPTVSFLLARPQGVDLCLLPISVFCRAKPPDLLYRADRRFKTAPDLNGARIGVNSYSASTSVWMQKRLAEAGADLASLSWLALEGPQVSGFFDPPRVRRAPAGSTLSGLLESGRVDAIVSTVPSGAVAAPAAPVAAFAASSAAAAAPSAAIKVMAVPTRPRKPRFESRHMLVARRALVRNEPALFRDLWAGLMAGFSGQPQAGEQLLCGVAENRGHLQVTIDTCRRLGLLNHRVDADVLFEDVRAALSGCAI